MVTIKGTKDNQPAMREIVEAMRPDRPVLVVAGPHQGRVFQVPHGTNTFRTLRAPAPVYLPREGELAELVIYVVSKISTPFRSMSWWVALPHDDKQDPCAAAMKFAMDLAFSFSE